MVKFNELDLEKVNKAYSSTPWWYDLRGFLILTFAYQSTLPAQIRFFSKNIGSRHLEAAIGTGTLFDLILKWRKFTRKPNSKIVGVDYAEKMIDGAKRRFRKVRMIELQQRDVANMHFESDSFDTANIANSIHCLPEVSKGLVEIFRVLKPGGTLAGNVLLVPKGKGPLDLIAKKINKWGIKKGILNRAYTQEEMQTLLRQAGFTINFEEIRGNCLNFIAEKQRN